MYSLSLSAEMTYYRCRAVFQALEAAAQRAGTAGTNVFGSYSDGQLREWSAIVAQFPQSCIHLADAAKVIAQLTTYEMCVLVSEWVACWCRIVPCRVSHLTAALRARAFCVPVRS
jgi:hypothetical protein